jgi:hypothetical protein
MSPQHKTLTRQTLSLLLGCTLLAMSAFAQEAKRDAKPSDPNSVSAAAMKVPTEQGGIWKSVVPPVKMKGMFDDHDPIGLVAGKLIPADCSLNWTDPDTHKLYCFTSATSLVYFLDSPQTYLAEAERSWRTLKGKQHSLGHRVSTRRVRRAQKYADEPDDLLGHGTRVEERVESTDGHGAMYAV